MEYIETVIKFKPFSEEKAEMIIAEISDLGYDGFIIEGEGYDMVAGTIEGKDFTGASNEGTSSAVSGYLKAYIPKDKYSAHNLKTVLSSFGNLGSPEISFSSVMMPDKNWNAILESGVEPVVVDNLCTLKATFHKGLPKTRYQITIDPEMAFGTGHHQTTYLMMEALLDYRSSDNVPCGLHDVQILDMGCGTGVLAILAAKMGAMTPVHAIDIDPVAVRSARKNCKLNKVGGKVTVLCGDASLIQAGKYDMILANINRNILLEDMSTYSRALRPGGELIVSGFYVGDIEMLNKEALSNSLEFVSNAEREKWARVKYVKK